MSDTIPTAWIQLNPERIKCVIRNAQRMSRPKYLSVPLWAFVSRLTGHGCQISTSICMELGFDPCLPASKRQ